MNDSKLLKGVLISMFFACFLSYVHSQTIIQLNVNQPPSLVSDAGIDASIIKGDTVEIGGSPTAIGGTPPYSYTWTPNTNLSDPTIPNPQVFPDATTTYNLTIIDDISCSSSSSVKITVSTSSISEGSDIGLKIYPNPNNGTFNLVLEGHGTESMILEILNNVGQIVYKEEIERLNGNYKSLINISEYSEGVYMLRLSGDQTNILQRLIVN